MCLFKPASLAHLPTPTPPLLLPREYNEVLEPSRPVLKGWGLRAEDPARCMSFSLRRTMIHLDSRPRTLLLSQWRPSLYATSRPRSFDTRQMKGAGRKGPRKNGLWSPKKKKKKPREFRTRRAENSSREYCVSWLESSSPNDFSPFIYRVFFPVFFFFFYSKVNFRRIRECCWFRR